MPERVTKEERQISLLIEKARNAKEILIMSLENNRNPAEDESEHVKLKRPKAENHEPKFVSNDGPASNSSYAGETFKKAISILKAISESDWEDNPMLNDEARESFEQDLEQAHSQMSKILLDVKSGETDISGQMGALMSMLKTMKDSISSNVPESSQQDINPPKKIIPTMD
tara:strand:+ start:49 stop:561 length:513 start_codon:yes stop_codon:yes gene_type:complete